MTRCPFSYGGVTGTAREGVRMSIGVGKKEKMTRERVPGVILGLMVLAVPLVVWRPAYDYTQVKLVVAQLSLAVLLISWIMSGRPRAVGSGDRWEGLLEIAVIAFLAWGALSALFSSYPLPALAELVRLTTYVLLFFCCSLHPEVGKEPFPGR